MLFGVLDLFFGFARAHSFVRTVTHYNSVYFVSVRLFNESALHSMAIFQAFTFQPILISEYKFNLECEIFCLPVICFCQVFPVIEHE